MQPNSSVASAEVPDTWAAPALTLAAPVSRTEGLRHWTMPGFVLIIIGLFTVQLQDTIRTDEFIIPGLVICLSGLVLLPSIRKALRRRTHEMFADHLLVLSVAFIVYFVAGALLVPFGPAEQAEYALAYYRLDA